MIVHNKETLQFSIANWKEESKLLIEEHGVCIKIYSSVGIQ